MNHGKIKNFKRSNSFNLRLNYDKMANKNNNKTIEFQKSITYFIQTKEAIMNQGQWKLKLKKIK